LNRKDAVSATSYLNRITEHTKDFWNNMGVLEWLQGEKNKVAEYFYKGGIRGADNAAELGTNT